MKTNIHTANKTASDFFDCAISNLAVLVLAIGIVTEAALTIAAIITEDSALMACALVAAVTTSLPITLEVISGELKKED